MKLNQEEKEMFSFKKHECLKDLTSLLTAKNENEIICLEKNKSSLSLFNKLENKSKKIGSLYFKKLNKGFEFQLLLIEGVTLIKEQRQENEFIFIRSSDLVFL